MTSSAAEPSQVDVELQGTDFFEPTLEESIMASGLHQQFIMDDDEDA